MSAKNIAFLLGAGCSSLIEDGKDLGIPTMAPLAKEFCGETLAARAAGFYASPSSAGEGDEYLKAEGFDGDAEAEEPEARAEYWVRGPEGASVPPSAGDAEEAESETKPTAWRLEHPKSPISMHSASTWRKATTEILSV